eukprot:m.419692 g.419692  ORF g.419692 m.419692 type:complete len:404 (-) comp21307_c0_seq3:974-2185(-)
MGRRKESILSTVFPHRNRHELRGPLIVYPWQEPGTPPSVLHARREELLGMNLVTHTQLRDEWQALIVAMDVAVQQAAQKRMLSDEQSDEVNRVTSNDYVGSDGATRIAEDSLHDGDGDAVMGNRSPLRQTVSQTRARSFLDEFLGDGDSTPTSSTASSQLHGDGGSPRISNGSVADSGGTADSFTAGMLPGTAPNIALFETDKFNVTDEDIAKIAYQQQTKPTLVLKRTVSNPILSPTPAGSVPHVSAARTQSGGSHRTRSIGVSHNGRATGAATPASRVDTVRASPKKGARTRGGPHSRRKKASTTTASSAHGVAASLSPKRPVRASRQPRATDGCAPPPANDAGGASSRRRKSPTVTATPPTGKSSGRYKVADRYSYHKPPMWSVADVSILGRRPKPSAGG